MPDWPLPCPLVWCPKSETPMSRDAYRQHQRRAHFPDGSFEVSDTSDWRRNIGASNAGGPPVLADGGVDGA